MSVGHCRKAPADVIDWERHLIMGLYTTRLVVWKLKTEGLVIGHSLLAAAIWIVTKRFSERCVTTEITAKQ